MEAPAKSLAFGCHLFRGIERPVVGLHEHLGLPGMGGGVVERHDDLALMDPQLSGEGAHTSGLRAPDVPQPPDHFPDVRTTGEGRPTTGVRLGG